jgi:tRNA dimethylallyltransferase
MRIGNARPSVAELSRVPHHFVADRSVTEPLSAGRFAAEATDLIERLGSRYDCLVVVGGSELYLRALCEGLDDFPEVSGWARTQVQAIRENEGLDGLQRRLREVDPDYYQRVDLANGRRLERALRVSLSAGRPYSSYLGQRPPRPFAVSYYALLPDRRQLYRHINARVDRMVADGLAEEARRLCPFAHLPSLQTVGYREWWDHFDGRVDLDTTIGLIKRNSRRYAKLQYTAFRHYQAVSNAAEIVSKRKK